MFRMAIGVAGRRRAERVGVMDARRSVNLSQVNPGSRTRCMKQAMQSSGIVPSSVIIPFLS